MTREIEQQLEQLVAKFGEKEVLEEGDPLVLKCKWKDWQCVANAIRCIARKAGADSQGVSCGKRFVNTRGGNAYCLCGTAKGNTRVRSEFDVVMAVQKRRDGKTGCVSATGSGDSQ